MSTQTVVPLLRRNHAITDRRFYLGMALVCTLLIFVGFSRSYYLKAHFPLSPSLSLLVQIHGAVFTLWMLYFILQTVLIAVRKPRIHRTLGILGVAIASAMVILGLAVSVTGMRLGHGGVGQDAETILLVGLIDITLFLAFFLAGWIKRRDREAHQRLMLLAVVVGLTGPGLGRLGGFGIPVPALSLINLVLIFAGPVYDLLTRRRIHPAYLAGVAIALATFTPLRFLVGRTAAWHHVAHAITRM